MVLWMVLLTLALALASGLSAGETIDRFNVGFGRALGEFALILLPSFALAAALSTQNVATKAVGRTAALASPAAGAGMICPDTAYAALSPAAGPYKIETVFGAYTGFKLLYPAGPLIVATGLGVSGMETAKPATLLMCGGLLTLPVWAAGILWGRLLAGAGPNPAVVKMALNSRHLFITFAPFLAMAGLLFIGGAIGQTGLGLLDFLLTPKGALWAAAILALLQTPLQKRRECLDSAVRRSGSLLLIIGAAGAFGAVLTGTVNIDRFVPQGSGMLTLMGLFVLTALFKLAQGSSMATFAAVGPVASPIVMASGVNDIAAVFAICLGSFIAILPNDSYYWMVRRDALENQKQEGRAVLILSGGTSVQALAGMAVLLAVVGIWL